jgi:hypothetical protein
VISLTWFCLSAYGLTQVLVYGKIFDNFRPDSGKIGELLRCPMCVGFWVGIFLWTIRQQTELFTFDDSAATAFLLGSASSGSSYVLSTLFGDSGIKIEKLVYSKGEYNETNNKN